MELVSSLACKLRFVSSLALLGCAVVSGSAQNTSVEDAFRRGALAMHNGRSADAEANFREAVRLAPQMPEAHLDLGLVLGRNGKLDEAIQSIQTAVRLDPKLNSAHMFLGIFLYQANRQSEATAELKQELALSPDNVEALTWLGTVELAAGHPELATGPLDRAAQLQPDDLNILEYRGRAHNLVTRDTYARMARIDPGSWHVHRVQAELYSEDGRHADAIAEYEAAVKLEPRNPDLFEALGDEYRKTSQLDLARKAFAQELELSPHNAIAMYDLGSVDIEQGKYAEGVPLLETMLSSYNDAPVAEYYLGRGLAALNKNEEGLKWLQKSVNDDPSGEVAKRSYYELARLYRKMQRPAESEKALAEYTRLREASDKQSAQQIQDWRKITGQPAQSGPEETKPNP
jgi:tetratricopeptide (TPR) repeat protein